MFFIENIDATIIAQAPKMRPHIDQMRENIAGALGDQRGSGQCQGDYGGGTWLHGGRKRNLRAGGLPAHKPEGDGYDGGG